MTAFDSSSIAAAGYDRRRRILRLRYVGGETYDYKNVPAPVFHGLMQAPSKGRFVNWCVKPYYAYVRVNGGRLRSAG